MMSWPNDSPGVTAAIRSRPVHQFQSTVSSELTSGTGQWKAFKKPIKLVGSRFVVRDDISAGGGFYRLLAPGTNVSFIIPPNTGPANTITAMSAFLTGSVTPAVSNMVYWFEYGTDTNYSQSTPTNSLDTSYELIGLNLGIGGLTPLTLYHFQLVVMDDWGAEYTQYGGDQTFTTLALPPVVNTDDASSITATSAVLNGRVNPNGSPAHARFEYGSDTTYGTNAGSYYTTTFASDEPYSTNLTGLTPSTTYYYRAVAFNGTGEGVGLPHSFTTAAPQVPPAAQTTAASNVILISGYTYSAQLNATVNPNGVDTRVYFQYGVSPGSLSSTTPPHDLGSGTTPLNYNYTVNTLNQLTASTYYFQIVATNSVGVTNGGILSVTLP
jgi:hypothetical protein